MVINSVPRVFSICAMNLFGLALLQPATGAVTWSDGFTGAESMVDQSFRTDSEVTFGRSFEDFAALVDVAAFTSGARFTEPLIGAAMSSSFDESNNESRQRLGVVALNDPTVQPMYQASHFD